MDELQTLIDQNHLEQNQSPSLAPIDVLIDAIVSSIRNPAPSQEKSRDEVRSLIMDFVDQYNSGKSAGVGWGAR